VREEAWPDPVNAEELHDSLLWLSCLTEAEAKATPAWCDWLARDSRVTRLKRPEATLWIPAERLTQLPNRACGAARTRGDGGRRCASRAGERRHGPAGTV